MDKSSITINNLAKKRVLIYGLGREGESSYRLLRRLYPQKRLGLADRRSLQEMDPKWREIAKNDSLLDLYFGDDCFRDISGYQVVIKSPGIAFTAQEIKKALSRNIIVTSETEIFLNQMHRQTIGVTGTKGKSSTSTLIHHLIKDKIDSILLGNMGVPAFLFWDKTKNKKNWFVYEMSSHQLDRLKISPHIAVFLNLMPDHLDYFKTTRSYFKAKSNIAMHQSRDDFLIYNMDDKKISAIANDSQAQKITFSITGDKRSFCFWDDMGLWYRSKGQEKHKLILEEKNLREVNISLKHNLLPAVIIAKMMGVSDKSILSRCKTYKSPRFRLEFIGKYKEIEFYNDSAATIPEASISALVSLNNRITTLIIGGSDKFLDYRKLAQNIVNYEIKHLITFPITGPKIASLVKDAARKYNQPSPKIKHVKTMKGAITHAYRVTPPGRICLLSPASASFSIFKDYQDRGEAFNYWVQKIGNDSKKYRANSQ